ncbi:uncharacterized protein LOC142625513 [Castanea sativa]|uniref:uncharacterized protein LOC142625513 n=1 Tax=Castanea sativa TaxID=21020 RepID=UPI003F65143D
MLEVGSVLMEAWRLRDTEDCSSRVHFNSSITPYKIMNILIWNCRGAMKPQFRKTVMDLVEWHSPIIMVITETRLSGARAEEIIETLPFEGAAMADTIGFAGGSWLLWRPDLVQVDVLAATEQEIHAIIRLSHADFPAIVREAWAGKDSDMDGAIKNFTSRAQRWNKEVFGNVFAKKKQLLARLLGTQRALANNPNNFLINLQDLLSKEYNLILQLEEEIWAMKSRTNWTIFGERNTAYFHMSTMTRRSKNRITSIQNDEGEWVHNVEEVKEIFISNFKKLYQTDQTTYPLNQPWESDWCGKLSEEEAINMAHMPSDLEI